MRPTASYAPPKEIPVSVHDLIGVKAALAELLEEEASLMDTMQIDKVGKLQERKLKLTGLLERHMRYLVQHPEVAKGCTAEEKRELQQTAEAFRDIMRRNYDKLLVARAVNGVVVKCVTQIIGKKERNPVYNARGAPQHSNGVPISVTLNQTV